MYKLSLVIVFLLSILTKDAAGQYGPMLSNVSSIINTNITNGLGHNPSLSFLANHVAHEQHVSADMLQHVNITAIVHLFDQYSEEYLENHCDKADEYFELLLSLNGTEFEHLLTLERIEPLLACRKDCHFMELFESNLTSHYNTSLFLAEHLPPHLAPMCSMGISIMMGFTNQSFNASVIIDLMKHEPSINLAAIISPVTIRRLHHDDAMHLIGNLTSATGLTPDLTRELGRFVQKNAALGSYLHIASGVPIDLIANASLSDALSCLQNCDLHNFDNARLNMLVRSILHHDSSSSTLSALINANSAEILEAIPDKFLRNMDLSHLDSSHLPLRGRRLVASQVLHTTHLTDIHDSSTLLQILPILPPSLLQNVTGNDTIETYGRLLAADRNSTSESLTSSQRSAMLRNVLDHFKNETGSSTAHISETEIEELAELFIEANETIIKSLAQNHHVFEELISEIAEIPESRCVDYKAASRSLLAGYAISTLAESPSSPDESDLDMIGPCLASALSGSIISTITPTVLHNRIFYFNGAKFQPDAQAAQAFSNKLSSIMQLDVVKADTISFLSDLGDSIVFLTGVGNVDDSILYTYGGQWLEEAKETRDTSNEMVQHYRLGVSGGSNVNTMFMQAQSAVIHSMKEHAAASHSSHRRRRSTSTTSVLTCDDCSDGKICLTKYADSVCQFSLDDLAGLSNDDMATCLSIIGSATGCTQKNLTDIAHLVIDRLYNDSIPHIPDEHIQEMNQLIEGLAPENISMLDIESLETINVLGQLTGLTSDQLHSLMMPIRHILGASLDSGSLIILGNISCGLNDTDVSMISDAEFNASIPILSELENNAGNCSGVYPLYNRTRQIYGVNNLLTPENLGMLGSVAGGMPPEDAENVTNDMASAITADAFGFMQVGSLEVIAINNSAVLSTTQLTSITNSPVYSSLSPAAQTSLSSSVDSTGSSTTTTSSNDSPRRQICSWFVLVSLLLSTIIAISLSETTD